MNIVFNSAQVLVSIIGLWFGAVWLVDSASKIPKRLGISELIIGLTVVAFGTSAPEFAVTVIAALKGQSSISVGNVVGSNIFNLGFILGGVALIRPIRTTPILIKRDGGMLIGTSLLVLLLFENFCLTRPEGILLVSILFLYLLSFLFCKSETISDISIVSLKWYDVPKLLVGIGIVIGSGHLLVNGATNLAQMFGISEWVIGVIVVAAGTSAPEFATSLVAAVRKHYDISAGNLIGSDLFNLLGVLGFAAILRPLSIEKENIDSLLMLAGLIILVVIMMRTRWKLSRAEGGVLVGLNLIRWIIDINQS